jgi:predicted ATPase
VIRKELPDGTKVERVNHLEQSPKENLTDMVVGFFDGLLINKENLRQIFVDILEYLATPNDFFGSVDKELSEKMIREMEEGDKLYEFSLSECSVYLFIAENIMQELEDTEFARQVYVRCEELANSVEDYSCLAASIKEYLKDKEWSERMYEKARSMVKTWSDLLCMNMDLNEN